MSVEPDSAMEKIRRGINNDDMEQVKEGWTELTGETFEKEEASEQPTVDDFAVDHNNTHQRLTKKQKLSVEQRENLFVDDGSIKIEEPGADFINDTATDPVKRSRQKTKFVEAKCYLCGETETIHPSHTREHYRCAKCCKG